MVQTKTLLTFSTRQIKIISISRAILHSLGELEILLYDKAQLYILTCQSVVY